MPEKKISFGDTPLYGTQTLEEGIIAEKIKAGYAYEGKEKLAENDLIDGVIQEVITQSMQYIEKKYKERNPDKEVYLRRNPKDENEVWVFLKTK